MSIPPPAYAQLPLPDAEAYPGEPREYAHALMQRKDDIEKEIDTLQDVLASHGATAATQLVDPEGYPRGDIDIYAIRHARAALVRLRNDRSEVVRRLATALESAFDAPPQASASSSSSAPPAANGHHAPAASLGVVPDVWPDVPIARVNSVAEGSPAAEAGLRASDIIYSFSGITASSQGGMAAIGPAVARSIGQPLRLLILRGDQRLALRLTPRSGLGGYGVLGCHILPV